VKTKPCLTLEDCKKIGAACEAEARKNKWNVVLPVQGGVPITVSGECVGAVGVSGVQSHEDEQIANAGIAALGLGN